RSREAGQSGPLPGAVADATRAPARHHLPVLDRRRGEGDGMTRCTQPGCSGEIVDGYCMVCGMPGETGPAVSSAVPSAAAPAPPALSGRCSQPGCPGTIADGYCTVCGAPAGAAPLEGQA